jgi:hypothetical protein
VGRRRFHRIDSTSLWPAAHPPKRTHPVASPTRVLDKRLPSLDRLAADRPGFSVGQHRPASGCGTAGGITNRSTAGRWLTCGRMGVLEGWPSASCAGEHVRTGRRCGEVAERTFSSSGDLDVAGSARAPAADGLCAARRPRAMDSPTWVARSPSSRQRLTRSANRRRSQCKGGAQTAVVVAVGG